ncbi:insulinase family protein, partial [bacterium]|nr:insulinase family protein [bacterium]
MIKSKRLFYITVVFFITAMSLLFVAYVVHKKIKNNINNKGKKIIMKKKKESKKKQEQHVVKKVLDNGLTVLVRSVKTIPKVCVQIWYNVGSKDEKDGEKGIAHLIEHMIFKGTEKLSESDINVAIHKLSGHCNAFTAYDYTGYLFDMPTHHWKKVLPIMADCMTSASFKDEHLNSEMKAVIQELKMINDQHTRSLVYKMLSLMFVGHPYHYPIIGYKQDLWNIRGSDLKKFYKKHYIPNNATLIVVGDVNAEDVAAEAQKYFGTIKADKTYKKEQFYLDDDIASKSVTIYRDIKLAEVMLAFKIPGSKLKGDHVFDIAALALANGKSSRLHKKLVDELQLVTAIGAFSWRMFDHGLFFFHFEPKDIENIEKIESIIFNEINDIAKNGLKKEELVRSTKIAKMQYYSNLEDIGNQAYDIGKWFLATEDKDYAFNYLDVTFDEIDKDIKNLLSTFFRKSVVHEGKVLPLEQSEKKYWALLQEKSDALDGKILSQRVRTTDVESPRYANSVSIEKPTLFDFPKSQ